MDLAAVVGHTYGLSGPDAEIRRFESPSRMSDEGPAVVYKRREQHSKKVPECSVASAHTRTSSKNSIKRYGITIVRQRDPGILTLDLRSHNGRSEDPNTHQYNQPIGQNSQFSHF